VFSFTINPRGQALQGPNLDLNSLDERVFIWKTTLNLFYQEHFPPRNFSVSEAGIKFHDRSHLLLQDYVGKTSEDFQLIYGESSSPSILEEILTYFCAQLVNSPGREISTLTTLSKVKENINFMRHIGYIDEDSFFLRQKEEIAEDIQEIFVSLSSSKDFLEFKQTLIQSSLDCPGWNVIGGGT